MDIGAWLKGLGLEQHSEAFAENGVDAGLLPDLTNEDLKDLGVARLADRKCLLKAIEELFSVEGKSEPREFSLILGRQRLGRVDVAVAEVLGHGLVGDLAPVDVEALQEVGVGQQCRLVAPVGE